MTLTLCKDTVINTGIRSEQTEPVPTEDVESREDTQINARTIWYELLRGRPDNGTTGVQRSHGAQVMAGWAVS